MLKKKSQKKPIKIINFLIVLSGLLIFSCKNKEDNQYAYNVELDFQCFHYFYAFNEQQDLIKAIPICLEAAKSGAPGSQYVTGISYFSGIVHEKNYKKAIYWLTKAAQNGHTGAIEKLEKINSPSQYKNNASVGL